MIKFFRHIRKSLIQENKMGKYFKYAIGEIILVMIGILLALQVNNWNERRQNEKAEQEILAKLHVEFKENKNTLRAFRLLQESEIKAHSTLLNLIGASKEELAKHNLDSIFFTSLGASDLVFADNTFKNLIQSGRLDVLKNKNLSALLYEWNALSEIRNTRLKKLDDWTNNHYTPYLLSKISFKEMDSHGNYSWGGKSKVKPEYHPLFQEVKFENFLDNNLWLCQQVFERILETEKLLDNLIQATSSYQ